MLVKILSIIIVFLLILLIFIPCYENLTCSSVNVSRDDILKYFDNIGTKWFIGTNGVYYYILYICSNNTSPWTPLNLGGQSAMFKISVSSSPPLSNAVASDNLVTYQYGAFTTTAGLLNELPANFNNNKTINFTNGTLVTWAGTKTSSTLGATENSKYAKKVPSTSDTPQQGSYTYCSNVTTSGKTTKVCTTNTYTGSRFNAVALAIDTSVGPLYILENIDINGKKIQNPQRITLTPYFIAPTSLLTLPA